MKQTKTEKDKETDHSTMVKTSNSPLSIMYRTTKKRSRKEILTTLHQQDHRHM